MADTEKDAGNEPKTLIKITDKYHMGFDAYNVIIYTKRVTKKGATVFDDPKYFGSMSQALERVFEIAAKDAINYDFKVMSQTFFTVREQIKEAAKVLEDLFKRAISGKARG